MLIKYQGESVKDFVDRYVTDIGLVSFKERLINSNAPDRLKACVMDILIPKYMALIGI